ncbi:MAG: cytochrome b N-terminal domain-containing protein [Firmicutes bacterium]|nr:cytochrome b N-terminal domain-containing protein [Bacillota bacterium]
MFRNFYRWLDDRFSIGPAWEDIAVHPAPPHVNPKYSNWAFIYCLGGITFFLVVLQILTGIFLMMYYVPDVNDAYISVKYIEDTASFGSIVRGMHHWGASASLVFIFMHTLRVFYTGSYKNPRELNWIVGVLLLLVLLLFGFTGYLLPWDQKAYWATQVGVNIADSLPILGPWIKSLLVGGAGVNAMTIPRFFTIHVMILPAILMVLLVGHFLMIRRQSISGPL